MEKRKSNVLVLKNTNSCLIITTKGKKDIMRKVGFLELLPNQDRVLLDTANRLAYQYIMESVVSKVIH
jgi:hypothetical protein